MNSNKTILQNKSSEVIHQKRFFKNDLEMMEMEKNIHTDLLSSIWLISVTGSLKNTFSGPVAEKG